MEDLDTLRRRLRGITEEFPNSYSAKLKADRETLSAVLFYTFFLPEGLKLKTRVYRILNGLDMRPACAHCGKSMDDRDVKNLAEGYRKYCSPRCAKDSDARKLLFEKTCIDRYGVRNPSELDAVKEKKKETCLKNYGVDNPAKSGAVAGRISRTNIERYGVGCAVHSPGIAAKTEATNLERYGVTSFSKTREFIEKTTASNRRRFGVDYPNQDPEFRRRSQKRYTYKGVGFDSSPELAFFIYAEDHGIRAEYQPAVSFEYEVSGRLYRYQPDFRTDAGYVEFKGLQFFENKDPAGKMINPYDRSMDDVYEAKHQCMLRNGVRIVLPADYRVYTDYVDRTYGRGYLRGFRN